MIRDLEGKRTKISKEVAFIAPSADIIGDVEIGKGSSIWYQCVVRGDVMPIKIGENTNIQDGTVIHGTLGKWDTQISDNVTVGHKAMIHGCHIADLAFIGMGAILLDGCRIAEKTLVGAGSLVTEGTETKPGWLYLGFPAKPIRPLKEEELAFLPQSAKNYLMYTDWYKE